MGVDTLFQIRNLGGGGCNSLGGWRHLRFRIDWGGGGGLLLINRGGVEMLSLSN